MSLDGKLLHCEELNWAPASISCVEDLTAPVLDAAERLMKQFGGGRKWDGIGLSWPDAIIHNMIVGGETTKTKGLRENKDRDYETQLAELTALCARLGEFTNGENAVQCCNDGPMAAFTDAVEMAAAGEDISKGFIAYSLGNFCTPYGMSLTGISSYAPVIEVKMGRDGRFLKGHIHSFVQQKGIGPRHNKAGDVAREIKQLSEADVPDSQASIDDKGSITLRK